MRAPLLVALLLAGCAAPAATPGDDAAAGTDALALVDCRQTHTFAPYPVEAFAGMLPEGWTLQPADPLGRTTQFYLSGSRCARAMATLGGAAADVSEMKEVWGYLFVVPPEGVDEAYDAELWPLGGVVSHGDALRVYEAWGLAGLVAQGRTEILVTAAGSGAVTSRTWANSGEETFEVDAAARGEGAPFHEGVFRVWVPADDEDGVAGAFVYAWPEGGLDHGLGSGTLRYDGPMLNAPPAGAAVVHHVSGVAVNITRLP